MLIPSMDQAVAHRPGSSAEPAPVSSPRIGILVVAYNAASTLAQVLDRVPKDFRQRVTQVFVSDDASQDSTYLVGLGYKQITSDLPLTIVRHPVNLGYGGNQKVGYRMAIEHELDIIVLLHGDGQYAPECLEQLVSPLERGECDAVFGSRMMIPGAARQGGMPLYKYIGNKILTRFENRMLNTELTEFHSGYRAYSVSALKSIAFERNSDDFNFDTQIIIQLVDAGKRIKEVAIPTYYGDEICYVNGLSYAKDVTLDVLRYRTSKMGLTSGAVTSVGDEYTLKESADSSHGIITGWLQQTPPCKVLDLGCSSGQLSARLRALGHHVTGVDVLELPEISERVDEFIQADLDHGLPADVQALAPFHVVIAADVIEHLRDPERLLADINRVLAPGGELIASIPNFGHWYPRARTLLGLFDYDQRGLLDKGHVRFFTRRGLMRRLDAAGFKVRRFETTGLPLDVLAPRGGRVHRTLRAIDRVGVLARPTLFGYQFVCQCRAGDRVDAATTISGGGG
jgi:glycosyltransferase involved in cell wall biosynthesis